MVGNVAVSVHLPLYLGVAGMLASSAWALVDQLRWSRTGFAVPAAFAGSLIQTAGETWHACSHLQLTTHIAPIAFAVSFIGMVIVIAALVAGRHESRRRAREMGEGRRVAPQSLTPRAAAHRVGRQTGGHP
jgi:hypothetical protein